MLMELSLLEGPLLLWIQTVLRCPLLDPLICFYTQLGNAGLLWIAASLLLLLHPSTRRAGLAGLLALVFSLLITNVLLKPLVERTRPWLVIEGLIPLVREKDPLSFPSGHTSAAFAAAVAWFRLLPRKWMGVTGLILAVLMGLSRLYVGVHFPTDVLCGALAGFLSGILGRCLLEAFLHRRELNKKG